ncbi:MAG: helix-turn-helix domain-containing protein [Chloroflexota bacterium]|nr:helix-turn-helix domain-containing protein [Chloroflexota bacterium]
MPWKETCVMDQKVQMIGDWIKDEVSITELSELYDVSRPTIYKWIARYEKHGADGLKELRGFNNEVQQMKQPTIYSS